MKDFQSEIMNNVFKTDRHFKNRIDDFMFTEVTIRHLLNRTNCYGGEDVIKLMNEMKDYIHYLYKYIDTLEKDKQYLLKQYLKEKYRKHIDK